MQQKPTISQVSTTGFLQELFRSEINNLLPISGGEWSQAWSFVQNGEKYILRWSNTLENFERDAIAATYSCMAMPIPKIVHMGQALDMCYAISPFAPGVFFDNLPSSELERTLPALLGLFDGLRDVNLSGTSGFGGWDKSGTGSHTSWKAFLRDVRNDHESQLTHGWYNNLAHSTIGIEPFDRIYAALEKLVEKCPENRELIHSDLLNFNLLVADNKISAVIDWGCSLYGDSLYDIAWFIFYAPYYPQFAAVNLCERALDHYRRSDADQRNLKERLLGYQLHIGLGWISYHAFKQTWSTAREAVAHTLKVLHSAE